MPHRQGFHATFTGACQRVVAGSFIPAGAGAIVTKYGTGFTVARAGVGLYTVTLDAPFAWIVAVLLTPQFATTEGDAHQLLLGDTSIANRLFQIKHLGSADVSTTDLAAADVATAGTSNRIHFLAVVAESDVPGAGI
jgi:hypothetical protein